MIAFYNFLSFLALLNLSSVKCFFKDRLDYGDGKSGFEILAFNLEAAPRPKYANTNVRFDQNEH